MSGPERKNSHPTNNKSTLNQQASRQDAFKNHPNKISTMDGAVRTVMGTAPLSKSKFITRVHSMDNNYMESQLHGPTIGSKLYTKNSSVNGSAGGSNNFSHVGIANGHKIANSKLIHQNSTASGPNSSLVTVVEIDKLEAAKKRREDNVEKEQQAQVKKVKPNWKQRLKWMSATTLSLTVIFSGSSLLFIIPLVVDPILLGFKAQFSDQSVKCRTISYKYEFGTAQCGDQPSCREGCTADVYNCTFIYVTYTKEPWSSSSLLQASSPASELNSTNSIVPSFNESDQFDEIDGMNEFPMSPESLNDHSNYFNATLYATPTGCGYPPELNCSDFDSKFTQIGRIFPCYYSQSENSMVVPYYSQAEDAFVLGYVLGLPLLLLILASILLFLLLKWDVGTTVVGDEDEAPDETKEGQGQNSSNGSSSKISSQKDKWARTHHQQHHSARYKNTDNTSVDELDETTIIPSTSTALKANGHGPPKDSNPESAPAPSLPPTFTAQNSSSTDSSSAVT